MNNQIENILEAIKKSGLPLEIFVSSLLEKDEWSVKNQINYIDPDKKIERPIDVTAEKIVLTNQVKDFIYFELIIECKRDIGNLVFYTVKEDNWKRFIMNDYFQGVWDKETDGFNFFDRFDGHYLDQNKRIGVIHFEPLKDGKKEKFQSAKYQVIKALRHQIRERKNYLNKHSDSFHHHELRIYYPVIVFDGSFFELTYEHDLKLEKTEHILYKFNHRGKMYLIDVVTKEYFPKYLSLINKELEFVKRKIPKLETMDETE